MIELNTLNELPKVFYKELSEFKHIFCIYNEIKAEITYIKSTVEIESKSFEGLSKGNIIHTKNFNAEIANVEDVTNLLQIEKKFVGLFEMISNEQMMSGLSAIINKKFLEISDEIVDYTKGLIENINSVVKELYNARNKYKTIFTKIDKNFKELEQSLANKKKMENDEKNSYNQTMRDKLNDRILNILNEFGENKIFLTSSFDECKRLEVLLNELIKNSHVNSIKFIYSSINHFRNTLEEIAENRNQIIKKQKEAIGNTIELINQTVLNLDNQEVNFNNLKGVKTEFEYLLGIFLNKQDSENNNSNNNDSLNIEEYFNKSNYQSSSITDHILSFIFTFLQIISLRKRQYTSFNKAIIEIVKNYENFISLSNKLIKNLTQPKVNIITNCQFLLQICDFVRSLGELVVRKYEEFTKFAIANFVNQIEHNILKDLNSDEVILNQIFTKIQKEYNNYKNLLNKLMANKERVVQNIEKIKENILKTSDDPNNFSKYEKQFLSLRTEEGNINESCIESSKKYKKFLEECLEITKKTVISCREKESQKTNEFKENLVLCLKLLEKNLNQILEFLDFRSQIPSDDQKASDSLKFICQNFANEFDLKTELNENNINILINEIINNPKEINYREIQDILSTAVFINKEEVIQNRDFNLNDLISNEELKQYFEKLDYLKTTSRKISIRNVNIDRKMHEDIFYIDADENVISNFSCALSDKILLQGKLYITNKKLVFYSWFNNSTLFGKTLIEIPKEDILEIERQKNLLFDNMILIKTKTTQFLFASLINREKCYYLMREVLFGESNPLNIAPTEEKLQQNMSPISLNIKPEIELDSNNFNLNEIEHENDSKKDILGFKTSSSISLSENKSEIPRSANCSPKAIKFQEISVNEANQRKSSYQQIQIRSTLTLENFNATNNNIKQEKDEEIKVKVVKKIDRNLSLGEFFEKKDFYKKLEDFNKKRLENFLKQNLIDFQITFIKNLHFGDIPLSYVYNSIFNPDFICKELGKDKNYWLSFLEIRQDYGVKITKLPNDEKFRDNLPDHITNKNNYLFSSFLNEGNVESFIQTEIDTSSPGEVPKQEYKYQYTHPILKKKFMGPSKLEVEDHYKIYFVSPTCLLVQIYSYMSGFMMMDTFYTVLQYKFETSYKYDSDKKRMIYDTTCTVSFHVEFVKETWFKDKIKNEGQADVEECVKTVTIPNITKVLESQKQIYNEIYDEFIRKHLEEQKENIEQVECSESRMLPENLFQKELAVEIEENMIAERPEILKNVAEISARKYEEAKSEFEIISERKDIIEPVIHSTIDFKKILQEKMYILIAVIILMVLLLPKLEFAVLVDVVIISAYLIYNKLEKIEKKLEFVLKKENSR